jgi:hypothetical protein
MRSQTKYSMTAWETSALSARRALAKADFRGSWRLRQLLARYLPSRDVICQTNCGFRLIVNPQMQRTIFESGTYEPVGVFGTRSQARRYVPGRRGEHCSHEHCRVSVRWSCATASTESAWGSNDLPLPDVQWDFEYKGSEASPLMFPTGAGCVLYPPGHLHTGGRCAADCCSVEPSWDA